MNISKREQRVLHTLAQGGRIRHERDGAKIAAATCFTREGHALADFDLALFHRMRRRGFLSSSKGAAYRLSRKGRVCVRAQLDNR